jgi:ABC-2 type transport system permease protein
MSKFMLLVKQLYSQKVKAKSFILMTAVYLLVIAGIMFWSDIKALFSDNEADRIAILNETEIDLTNAFISSDDTEWVFDVNEQAIEDELKDNSYVAAVTLSEKDGKLAAKVTSVEPLQLTLQSQIENTLMSAGQFYAMGKVNLTPEQTAIILDFVPTIESVTLNEQDTSGKTTEEKAAGMWASYISGFFIYFFVITYLSMITTDIASEKGSRALEMLLVSVRPETHFKAKITGVLLVAFTQLGAMIGFLFVLVRFVKGGDMWDSFVDVVNELNISYILYIVAFLITTIILFLIIGALFGSLVSKVEEAGQVMMPAMILTIIGFYIMVTGLSNPDTLLIKISSYIPFTSGMVMPMRIGATDISAFEPLLSLGLLVLTIVAIYFFTVSLYKRSVLTYSTGGVIQKLKSVFKYTT